MEADVTLDCYGLLCPLPVIKTAEQIKILSVGQVLEIIATDSGIREDLSNWCRSTGQEFLGIEEQGQEYRVFVRRLK